MTKTLSAFIAVLVLGLGACAEQTALSKPPGTYKQKTVSTDSQGTTTEREASTVITEDEEGNKTAVVKSKTTKDPKGLLNKQTTSESKKVIEEK